MTKIPISADSHITEPPNCYIDHIDPSYRDRAPYITNDERYGDIYVIEGMEKTIPIGLVAAAGKDPKSMRWSGGVFDELHRSGWDPKYRQADQDIDGVGAEILYQKTALKRATRGQQK